MTRFAPESVTLPLTRTGKTPGITLPSMQAQSALIETACQSAGLNQADTSYFEAHGTGTPAGDPHEMGALASVFGKTRTEKVQRVGAVYQSPEVEH